MFLMAKVAMRNAAVPYRLAWNTRSGRSSKWCWRPTRFAIYHRDSFDCVYCRLLFPLASGFGDLTLDHVQPRSQGGSNDPTNLVTCCFDCNSARQDRSLTAAELRRARVACARPINAEIGRRLARGEPIGQLRLAL